MGATQANTTTLLSTQRFGDGRLAELEIRHPKHPR